MFNPYYQDELLYLRELGREYAQAHPEVAGMLAEAGSDPDVERLLEGVAFLCGRIRQKLDDGVPELSQSLLNMFWPQYLRPVPAMTILQFQAGPKAGASARSIVAGAEVDAREIQGTRARFVTCDQAQVVPLRVETTRMRRQGTPALHLRLVCEQGATLGGLGCEHLRFFLSGDAPITREWYLALRQHLRRCTIHLDGETAPRSEALFVRPVGFEAEERLLDDAGRAGAGLLCLHEYFCFPERFLFFDLCGLRALADDNTATACDITFSFDELPADLQALEAEHCCLNCVPAINCFAHEADPIRVDPRRSDFRVSAAGSQERQLTVHSLTSVVGMQRGSASGIEIHPIDHLSPRMEHGGYEIQRRPGIGTDDTDCMLRLLAGTPAVETLSISIRATNGSLPAQLAPGDIHQPISGCPGDVTCRNLCRPSRTVSPPADGDVHWRLLSHLALDVRSLADVESLRALIRLHDFRAPQDRGAEMRLRSLLDGLRAVDTRPLTRLIDSVPTRGIGLQLTIDEEYFPSPGSAFLFACVLDVVLAESVALNSFSQLQVSGWRHGQVWQWAPRFGAHMVL